MSALISLVTLYQLAGYGLVSLGQLAAGWVMMSALRQRTGISLWWAFFLQSVVIGFAGFLVRKEFVFDA